MRAHVGQSLVALTLLVVVLLGNRPVVLASVDRADASGISDTRPVVAAPVVATPITRRGVEPKSATPVAPTDTALEPCHVEAYRAACDAAVSELAGYGLDIDDVAQWTLFGLRRFIEAVEQLADACGGGGLRAQRIARFTRALQTGPHGERVRAMWDATPQDRDGNPVRGGYAANRLYFNPNTLFLDVDTADEVLERNAAGIWWTFVHELAHLWDERSSPIALERHSAKMQRWLDVQKAAGLTDERPSSYAITGGMLEAFAESVAATITGDSAMHEYYGSPRDIFVRTLLCEGSNCLP